MKYLFLFTILIFVFKTIEAQTSRIALVKPNGVTTIHTTLQSAYDAASNDDYIYLPGGTFDGITIAKKLHIIGAGSNIDSSQYTGITKIPSLDIDSLGGGGSIEGIYFTNGGCTPSINFVSSNNISGYLIKGCYLKGGIQFTNWQNVVICKNYLGLHQCGNYGGHESISGELSNSFIKNNIVMGNIQGIGNCVINNNILFFNFYNGYGAFMMTNSIFNNNIFKEVQFQTWNSIFNNNTNSFIYQNNTNSEYNTITETFNEVFENPGAAPYSYDVHNNYHIKSTSACNNSGTDGRDRGIYGGSSPWIEGSIPSNPHIYFKNVADETNASGQLQIHFKVRTN